MILYQNQKQGLLLSQEVWINHKLLVQEQYVLLFCLCPSLEMYQDRNEELPKKPTLKMDCKLRALVPSHHDDSLVGL